MKATTLNISNDEYHRDTKRISNSMLSVFLESPPRFHAMYIAKTLKGESGDQFTIGSAAHDILLEGGDKVIEIPPEVLSIDGKRSGGNWKMWSSLNADKIQLKRDDYRQVMAMVESVRNRKSAAEILSWEGSREETVTWHDEETGFDLRCRMDIRTQNPHTKKIIVADLKTTQSVQLSAFAANAYRYGYHRQAAFYEMGVEALLGERPEFFFIAVEKSPPYVCRVVEFSEAFMERGRRSVRQGLKALALRYALNDWDVEGGDLIVSLPEPRFAKYEDEWDIQPTEYDLEIQ